MTKKKGYLILNAAVCALLAAYLAVSAVRVYRDGMARRAADPRASVYTPEIVADRLTAAAPLFLAFAGLSAAGLALGIGEDGVEKTVQDAGLIRDMAVSRVEQPSDAMRKERRARKRLSLLGGGLFALCMLPTALWLLNPAHFPEDDLEGMLTGLLRVLLPCAALGLGALMATAKLREASLRRETEAARAQLKKERAEGTRRVPGKARQPGGKAAVRAVLILAALILIVAGVLNGGAWDVLVKAITICTECVGLG